MAAHKCPNGHASNADGECYERNCPYYVGKRHDGIGRFTPYGGLTQLSQMA